MNADVKTDVEDDGLTAVEREELAADTASGGAPTQAAQPAPAEKEEPEAEPAADPPAAAPEPKPDPTATALSAIAESQERTAAVLADVAKAVAKEPAETAPPAPAAPVEPDWDAQRKALKEKYDAGDIDDEQYESQRENLIEQKAEWKAEQRANAAVQAALKQQDEDRQKQLQQDLDAQWDRSLKEFMAVEANASFLADPTRTAAFNAVLSAVAGEMPGANYGQMLNEALQRTQKAFGVAPATPAPDAKKEIEKAVAERAAKAGDTPPDLSRAPQAGAADERGNKFADLDSMNVDDLENKLARMSEEQVDEFLATAPGGLLDNPRS